MPRVVGRSDLRGFPALPRLMVASSGGMTAVRFGSASGVCGPAPDEPRRVLAVGAERPAARDPADQSIIGVDHGGTLVVGGGERSRGIFERFLGPQRRRLAH